MTDTFLWIESLANWPGARWLYNSGTAYMFVNATHILSIGLLVGAVLPLDLRLMTGRRDNSLAVLGPWLSRVAGTGLALAMLTGIWLFTVQPAQYMGNAAFLYKLMVLGMAVVNIGWQHANPGLKAAWHGGPISTGVRVRAGVSLVVWLTALVLGRWIGFI